MVETLLIGGGILIAFLLFIGWLVSTNDNEDTTTTTPPPSPDTQAEVIVPNNPFNTGINYSNIDIVLRGKAADGSSLQQFVVKAKDSSGNEHDQQITSVSGNQDQKNIQLSDIIGNATASSPLNIPLELIVVDDSPNNDVDHGQINIDDNTGGGGGGNGGDNNVDVDIDNAVQQVLQQLIAGNVGGGGAGGNGPIVIDNSQQQQQQQMAGGGVYGGINPQVYQMFMQQMQHMQMTQQQMMQQMMMFMQQNNYNQIDNEFMVQFMQQVMDIDIDIGDINVDGGGGSGSGAGDVNIEIQQLINNIDIDYIQETMIGVIEEIDISVSQRIEQQITFLFVELLQLIHQENYRINGDIIIIEAPEREVKVELSILIQYLNILAVIKNWEIRTIVLAFINQEIDINVSLNVKLEEIIVIYQESESSDEPNYSGENWEIFIQVIRESNIDNNVKSVLIDMFEGNWDQYPVNKMWVVHIARHIDSMANEDVHRAAQEVVKYIRENQIRNVNNEVFSAISQILYRNWSLDDQYLKPSNNKKNNMDVDQVRSNIESIAQQIQKDEQLAKEMIQLDEEALEDLKEALNLATQNKHFFQALEVAENKGLDQALNSGNAAKVAQILQQTEDEVGLDGQLTDPNYLGDELEKLEEIHRDLEEAVEDLKRTDMDAEKIEEIDQNLEETLGVIDQKHVQGKENEIQKMRRVFLGG